MQGSIGNENFEKVVERAIANDYVFGAQSAGIATKSARSYAANTTKIQDASLRLYEKWWQVFASDKAPPLEEGSIAPACDILIDFICFHAAASKGRGTIDKERRITADSCISFMGGFCVGFQRLTNTPISEEERQPVYTYIKTSLWEGGFVASIKKRKMLFQKADFDLFSCIFWTVDLDIFVHPRNLAQYPFYRRFWSCKVLSCIITLYTSSTFRQPRCRLGKGNTIARATQKLSSSGARIPVLSRVFL